MPLKKIKNGQTLLEAIFAIGVIALVLVTLTAVIIQSIANNKLSTENSQAAKLASEAIEKIRSRRDQIGWEQFSIDFPNGYSSTTLYPALAPFTRLIAITDETADKKRINITITWSNNNKAHQVTASSYLTKWQ